MNKEYEMQEVSDDVLASVSGGANTGSAPSREDFTISGVCRICEQRKMLNASQLCYDCACHAQRRSG